jgi:hypothetical protein
MIVTRVCVCVCVCLCSSFSRVCVCERERRFLCLCVFSCFHCSFCQSFHCFAFCVRRACFFNCYFFLLIFSKKKKKKSVQYVSEWVKQRESSVASKDGRAYT